MQLWDQFGSAAGRYAYSSRSAASVPAVRPQRRSSSWHLAKVLALLRVIL